MKRYLYYKIDTGLCVNVIVVDNLDTYSPDPGYAIEIIPAGSLAWTGWTRISEGNWVPPEQQPEE
jgi:hypothetical protein